RGTGHLLEEISARDRAGRMAPVVRFARHDVLPTFVLKWATRDFSWRRDRAPGPCPPQGRVAPSRRTGLEISVSLRSALPAAGPAAPSKPNRLRGRIVHERRAHRQYPRAPACWPQAACGSKLVGSAPGDTRNNGHWRLHRHLSVGAG